MNDTLHTNEYMNSYIRIVHAKECVLACSYLHIHVTHATVHPNEYMELYNVGVEVVKHMFMSIIRHFVGVYDAYVRATCHPCQKCNASLTELKKVTMI